jgi:hypothetical protein
MVPLEYPQFMTLERLHQKSEPKHTSLSLIDRVIKTIRDMAFNMRVGSIRPEIIRDILIQYNNAPHRGLSALMGFAISPILMEEHPALRWDIRRRLIARNQEIYMTPGFILRPGQRVVIFNENSSIGKRRSIVKPEVFEVIDFNGAFYRIRQIGNPLKIEFEPRWRLKPVDEYNR